MPPQKREQESITCYDTCVDLRVTRTVFSRPQTFCISSFEVMSSDILSLSALQMGFLTKLPGTRLVVRKPGGYSICVPCPIFYMGSEYRSSGSHTVHALTHMSATLQTDIYMHALFPFPITPHKLNGPDINIHSVNLKYTYSYTCVYTHVPWPSHTIKISTMPLTLPGLELEQRPRQ